MMKHIETIIVEDIKQNREALITLLSEGCPQITITAEAGDQEEAFKLITIHKPQLVFLDIQMKKGTTFDLLRRLNKENLIDFEIIFVTGYGRYEYATRAIEYAALDFITKPIDLVKLHTAVNKAVRKIDNKQRQWQMDEFLQNLSKQNGKSRRIIFQLIKGVLEFVEVNEIKYLEADKSVTIVHLKDKKKLNAMKNLGHYFKLLSGDYNFARISNKYAVNIDHVKKYDHKQLTVYFVDGTTIIASRRKGGELQNILLNKKYN